MIQHADSTILVKLPEAVKRAAVQILVADGAVDLEASLHRVKWVQQSLNEHEAERARTEAVQKLVDEGDLIVLVEGVLVNEQLAIQIIKCCQGDGCIRHLAEHRSRVARKQASELALASVD